MIFWNNALLPILTNEDIEVIGDGFQKGQAGHDLMFAIRPKPELEYAKQFNTAKCQVTFEGPSNPNIKFNKSIANTINCIWRAFLPGTYKIIINYDKKPIPGSPFKCKIECSEFSEQFKLEQLNRIECTGSALCKGNLNQKNAIHVKKINGMIGGLHVTMEGPSKAKVTFQTNQDGTLTMFYEVLEKGKYQLNILFIDQHITGSPFLIQVE